METVMHMTVDGIFNIKGRGLIVAGLSLWKNNVSHKIGMILVCGTKKWKVIGIDHFRQGCFSTPVYRHHGLQLQPIDHGEQPNIGDQLVLDS